MGKKTVDKNVNEQNSQPQIVKEEPQSEITKKTCGEMKHTIPLKRYLRFDSNSCYIDCITTAIMTLKGLAKLRKVYLSTALDIKPVELPFGFNQRYMDGVVETSSYLQQEMTRIQGHLTEEQPLIASGTLKTFRRLVDRLDRLMHNNTLKNKNDDMRVNWTDRENDPNELLYIFNKIYNVPANVHIIGSSNANTRVFFNDATVYWPKGERVSVNDYLTAEKLSFEEPKDSRFRNKYLRADYLYVKVSRGHNEKDITSKKHDIVTLDEYLDLAKNKKRLRLSAIIMHHGSSLHTGHYTMMIRYGECWYHYNNIGPELKPVGSYDHMIRYNRGERNVQRCCTGLFYTKV